ncbi:MAG: CBS domain-containing protein [bacterium]|nr:CBS domain-containing protein [bacterium]
MENSQSDPKVRSEFVDAYDDDERLLRGAILREPISALEPRKPVLVPAEMKLREAVTIMTENHTGCVCVVEEGVLVGIFTERDLLRAVQENIDPSNVSVGQVMTGKPETLRPEHGIALALNMMSEGGFRHIPLTDTGGRPVGIVAMRDIVRFICTMFPDVTSAIPPDPSAIQTEYGG